MIMRGTKIIFHHKEMDRAARKNLGSSLRRGVSSLLSFVILFAVVLTAIVVFLNSSKITIDSANTNIRISDAEAVMKIMDNRIRELAAEGNGSARLLEITTQGDFKVSGEEDIVQFEADATGFDQFSRLQRGNILFIAGNDVNCRKADVTGDSVADIFMENTYINATLKYVAGPNSAINTTESLIRISSRVTGDNATFSNSSVVIDGNLSTVNGTGFSDLQKTGSAMPACVAQFYVNSTGVHYDVFYKLYAGADFLVAEVRIRS